MTVGQIAAIVAAAAAVVFVGFAISLFRKIGKTLDEVRVVLADTHEQAGPILTKVDTAAGLVNVHLTNLEGVSGVARSVGTNVSELATNVTGLATVAAESIGSPVMKSAAFVFGLRNAVAARVAKKAASVQKMSVAEQKKAGKR